MGLVFEEKPRTDALKKRGCLGGVEASDGVDGEPDLVASDDGTAQRRAVQLRIRGQIVQKRVTLTCSCDIFRVSSYLRRNQTNAARF
jgi:hypothetical protein